MCIRDRWWHLVSATKERQAWCCLQVKLCDPCLSALCVPWCEKALYKYSSFPFPFPFLFNYTTPRFAASTTSESSYVCLTSSLTRQIVSVYRFTAVVIVYRSLALSHSGLKSTCFHKFLPPQTVCLPRDRTWYFSVERLLLRFLFMVPYVR